MSIEFGSFVRSKNAAFVRSPLRARNPSCGYFPGAKKKFSITIESHSPANSPSLITVTGDGLPARSESPTYNPGYWVPTIELRPGCYRGTYSITRTAEGGNQFEVDFASVYCVIEGALPNGNVGRVSPAPFRYWECFPSINPHARSVGDRSFRQWANSQLARSKGFASWPETGTYEWLSGRYTSAFDALNVEEGLEISFPRYRCPFRIWIQVYPGGISPVTSTCTFTLTGDSTTDWTIP